MQPKNESRPENIKTAAPSCEKIQSDNYMQIINRKTVGTWVFIFQQNKIIVEIKGNFT